MSKWTIRNRASVMTFDIEILRYAHPYVPLLVVVFMKEQLEEAVHH
jgi:hypothetical protein